MKDNRKVLAKLEELILIVQLNHLEQEIEAFKRKTRELVEA